MNVSDEVVLRMSKIEKRFPGVHALRGVDFELRRGEVHVLLGENGAGKSTLIKILSGAYKPDAGDIFLDGERIRIENPLDGQARGISVVYQEFNLIPSLSVAENIFLGRQPMSGRFIDWKTMNQNAETLLRELQSPIDPRVTVGSLGVAQQQMVEIAKALSLNARIIVMDEPSATLSDREIDKLFETIRTLQERGVSIIYISHRLEEVKTIGNRVTVLRDGELVGTEDIENLSVDDMIRMMIGRTLSDQFPKEQVALGKELLRVEGLGRGKAVQDVSFSLKQGEILGIAGLVGSGRSELARLIFGADYHDRGRILVDGEHVLITDPTIAIDHGIGLLPEDRKGQGLVLQMSVAKNTTLAAMGALFPNTFVLRPKVEREAADRYVRSMRVRTPSLDQYVEYLSGGNQQKTVIAKWLCSQSRILIFDEPTRGIDVGAKVEVYQLMTELVRNGAAIIMISSEMPEILGMSDRILVMCEGKMMGELSREEATEEKILRLAMGGTIENGNE